MLINILFIIGNFFDLLLRCEMKCFHDAKNKKDILERYMLQMFSS